MRLCIYGAGGMGRETLDIIRSSSLHETYTDLIFVTSSGQEEAPIPVICERNLRAGDAVVIALGDGLARVSVSQRLRDVTYPVIISKSALVSAFSAVGPGTVICPFASVSIDCIIGSYVIINCHAQVSHDCHIGDFVTISPHVSCNGWVEIQDGAFIGAGAVIRNGNPNERLVIGKNATVGLGAVVTRSVEPGATVVGLPARQS